MAASVASDDDIRSYLELLVKQLPTRDACRALGLSANSYTTLAAVCEAYGVEIPQRVNQHVPGEADEGFETTIELASDGSYKSAKLIEMDEQQAKDPRYILEAHGFDPDAWDLLSARNKIWNTYSTQDSVCTLYASSIHVRPAASRFDVEKIVERLKALDPVRVRPSRKRPARSMLEVPLFDMHFGFAGVQTYDETVGRICEIIEEKQREKTVITVGSDMFHVDNFRNTTANGTQVAEIDWEQAWADATSCIGRIIEAALASSYEVEVVYIKGNHDESMSWAFARMLEVRYPQARFDTAIKERKRVVWDGVFIGYTHGDKPMKDIDRVFMNEFPAMGLAAVREIHIGHFHHEVAKDYHGVLVRFLGTRNEPDEWHDANGFVNAAKRFVVFEYSPGSLETMRYV